MSGFRVEIEWWEPPPVIEIESATTEGRDAVMRDLCRIAEGAIAAGLATRVNIVTLAQVAHPEEE